MAAVQDENQLNTVRFPTVPLRHPQLKAASFPGLVVQSTLHLLFDTQSRHHRHGKQNKYSKG